MLHALAASLALAAVMTFGDFAWAAFSVRHTVVKGVLHGAAMCLCIGHALRGDRPAAVELFDDEAGEPWTDRHEASAGGVELRA